MPSPIPKQLDGMRIGLVFPDFLSTDLASYQDNGKFLGVVPPLSLLYVAASLQQAGAIVKEQLHDVAPRDPSPAPLACAMCMRHVQHL